MSFRFLEITIIGLDDPFNIRKKVADSMRRHVTDVLEQHPTIENVELVDLVLADGDETGHFTKMEEIMRNALIRSTGSIELSEKLEKIITCEFNALAEKLKPKLFFAPFMASKIFVFAFLIHQFECPGLLETYWAAIHESPENFFQDLCYFASLWFDPTLRWLFPYDNMISTVQGIMDEVAADKLDGTAASSSSNNNNNDVHDDANDDNVSVISMGSTRSAQSREKRKVGHHVAKNVLFMSRIRTHIPAVCLRRTSEISIKLRWIILKIPNVMDRYPETLEYINDIIQTQYRSILENLHAFDTATTSGLIVCMQFFTETHLEMVSTHLKSEIEIYNKKKEFTW